MAPGLGALAACCFSGCGYGFSSSLLPGHIKSVALPLMEDRTDRTILATLLADSLTEAFINNNTLKVTGRNAADSVVEGTILEYRRVPFTVAADETVLEYKVEIVLEARFVDVRKNDVIWEERRLVQWDTYRFTAEGDQPAETEQDGIDRTILKLTQDILNRTVEGW